MLLHLDYRDSRPIYVQIMDALRQQIASGVLLPEEKLPSVRELAASLSINPNTIQRSYRQLEMEGWIATGNHHFERFAALCNTLGGSQETHRRWLFINY